MTVRLSESPPNLCILRRDGADHLRGRPAEASSPVWFAQIRVLAIDLGWQILETHLPAEMQETVALVLTGTPDGAIDEGGLRRRFPHALIASSVVCEDADLVLPATSEEEALKHLLNFAAEHWRRNLNVLGLHREVAARDSRMRQLSEIALSLSTRMEFQDLLETILLEARRLAGCEAGSLYLLDEEGPEPALVFKLAQNDVVEVPFVEKRLSLSPESVAGYVALSGETLDIPDVYQIPAGMPFSFNRSFDESMGYRTRSMLVLPMRDHRHRVVGVLQFINRIDPTEDEPVAFGEEIGELLRAVASQAAVSIQKNLLIRDINTLFESFVQASVKTIEQRDPTTSGHSFRVAGSTVALLRALPSSGLSRFSHLELTDEHIREVRYAALLHDFGKIGVRENVLLKANKLTDERLEIIRFRIELQKERLRTRAAERELEMLHHGRLDFEVARRRVHRELDVELSILDQYFACIAESNTPNLRNAGDFAHLQEIREYRFVELDGVKGSLLTDAELLALSVRRGSLTPAEREEIESHVTHTRDFLAVLPWPPELARVPEIAGAHHEKLDGSGYPLGLVGDQIPLPSRVMTVCDIYDALTAMDRPYKPAMSVDSALEILHDEARLGLVDSDILNVFVDSRIYLGTSASAPGIARAL